MTGLFGKQWSKKIELNGILVATIRERESDRSGGFQNHVKETLSRLDGNTLEIDDPYVGKTYRYMLYPPGGGWQDCCAGILRAYSDQGESA